MNYFPLFFDLTGREALIVGGGEGALAKTRLLLKAGARVKLVAPRLGPGLAGLAAEGVIRHIPRGFVAGDVNAAALVIAATGLVSVDARVAEAARAAHLPVNVVDRPEFSSFIVPAIIDRDSVVVAVSTGGAAPALAARLRGAIERMLPRNLGRLVDFSRRLRHLVGSHLPDHEARRRLWDEVYDGPVGASVLAGEETKAEASLRARLAFRGPRRGSVALVGAGPGDSELVTVKGLRLIQDADVIVYDKLVGPALLDYARREALRIYVGKARGEHTLPQDEINALLVHHALQGRRVVRLKGGDPFIFGRGGEELDHLRRHGIDPVIVPGITAATACGAAAGIPLTHRGLAQAVTLVTGQGSEGEPEIDWAALARLNQTIALYMGVDAAPAIAGRLIGEGLSAGTPVAIVERASLPDQRVLQSSLGTLGQTVASASIRGPALIVIGEVAALGLAHEAPGEPARIAV